jgi:hypothetical protein
MSNICTVGLLLFSKPDPSFKPMIFQSFFYMKNVKNSYPVEQTRFSDGLMLHAWMPSLQPLTATTATFR